jgi:hypothetical protein
MVNLDYSAPNVPLGTAGNENTVYSGHRLGLLPDQGRPAIKFGDIAIPGAELPIPVSDDHITGVPAWNLGGNDQYGTCGPTALANYITMVYWNLLGLQVTVTDAAVWKLYAASGNAGFPPTPDNGVDLNYMLTQALKIGLEVTHTGVINPAVWGPNSAPPATPAGTTELVTPVAFAALNTANIDEVRRATAIFGGAELGVTLDVSQQTQTGAGLWDWSPSAEWGGHAILGAAYTGKTSGPDEEVITWQLPVETTDSFVSHQLDQGFAIILPCHLTHPNFLAGVNVTALAAQYQELTGQSFHQRHRRKLAAWQYDLIDRLWDDVADNVREFWANLGG